MQQVKRCAEEYARLAVGRDTLQLFSAVARYAEAERWLELVVDDESHRRGRELVPRPGSSILAGAAHGLLERIDQNLATLSIGDQFIYEELVLLLTHAIDIELVCEVLERTAMLPPRVPDSLTAMRRELRELAQSRRSRRDFSSAVAQLRRTFKLRSEWLSGDTDEMS